MRAVLDANVLVSALLSTRGAPAAIVRRGLDGDFELIVSPLLLAELERVLEYPKLRSRIEPEEVTEFVTLLQEFGNTHDDSTTDPLVRPPDLDDAYLVALAAAVHAVIVTGDQALLSLASQLPVYAPAEFLAIMEPEER